MCVTVSIQIVAQTSAVDAFVWRNGRFSILPPNWGRVTGAISGAGFPAMTGWVKNSIGAKVAILSTVAETSWPSATCLSIICCSRMTGSLPSSRVIRGSRTGGRVPGGVLGLAGEAALVRVYSENPPPGWIGIPMFRPKISASERVA